MKRKLYAILCVLVCLLLAGCLKVKSQIVNEEDDEGSAEKVEITFFGNKYEEANVRVIEEIIKDFMAENPNVSVRYESLKGTDYYDALLRRMEAGSGDDVFVIDHDSHLTLEASGSLADLSGLGAVKEYGDAVLTQMVEEDGSVHMLPTTVSMFGLYCNMGMLEKHSQKVPTNLKEFEDVCAYFKGIGITPIIANNDISLKTMATGVGLLDLYMEGKEDAVIDMVNNGSEKLSTYLRPGYELVKKFIDLGYVDADVALQTKKTSGDLELFEKGMNPFMLTGAWAAVRVKEAAPNLRFEVHPLPIMDDGGMVIVNPDVRLAVNENSKHKEEAMEFVSFFTRRENISKFADQQCSLSPLRNGLEATVAEIKPLVECYGANRVVIGSDTRLLLPIWNYGMQISRMLLGGKSVDEAMSWLDEESRK